LKVDLDEAARLRRASRRPRTRGSRCPGTELVRRYRGKDVVVRVREDGFECGGQIHRSLSSAVRQATGTPWNGFAFFGLGGKPGRKHGSHQ